MNVVLIAIGELRSTFTSPIGWLVLCGWLLVTGLFWILMVQNYVVQSQDLVFNPYAASELTLADYLLGPYFGNCAVLLIMVIPALSMRLFSEEVKQRTLELLLTSPISTFEIVAGKFAGAFAMVLLLLLCTAQGPLALYFWASPDPGPVVGGYLGLALLGAALLSLGMLASALTANQIVAMVLSFATALALLVVQWGSRDPSDWWNQLSILGHLTDLMRGAVKLSDVVYYLAFTGLFLFATHQRMESFRVEVSRPATREWMARTLAAIGLWSVALERALATMLDASLSAGFLAIAAVAFAGALVLWILDDTVPWKARAPDLGAATLALVGVGVQELVAPEKLDWLPASWLVVVGALPLFAASLRSEQGFPTARPAVALGGVLVLLAGGMNGLVTLDFGPFPQGALVLGMALLLEWAALDRRRVGDAAGSRSVQFGTGSLLLIGLATVLAVGTYSLARRNDQTWDLTKKQAFTLSDQARRVSEGLAFDVKVTAFFRGTAPGRDEFQHLIDRFHEANPRITVEYVDPLQQPRRAEAALVTGDQGTILLEGNGRDRRLEWEVTEDELVRALVMLGSTEDHPVCWSLGHGEPDPDDEFSQDGLGSVRLQLEGLNYKVQKLEVAKTGIDRACQVVVIARPTAEWFPYEREALAAYLAEGGRVLLLIDVGDVPDLADELERYGVLVGDDVVIDLNPKNQMLGVDDPSFVVLSAENFGEHPITRNMAAALVMRIARSVRAVVEPPAGIEVRDLLRTSPDAWGETDLSGATFAPDEGIEVIGEVPVMAVVEVQDPAALKVVTPGTPAPEGALEGAPNPEDLARGVPADFAPKAGGRMVVIGDSDFPANTFLTWGNNRDLFLNSIAWLVEEEDQIGERPPQGETLEISLAAQSLWCLVSVVLVPLAAAIAAMATLVRRRYL